VPAPLELGRRTRREDAQHGELPVAGIEPAAREHADVADDRTVAGAHRHREVALQPVPAEEAVAREACDAAAWIADHVALGDRLARCAGELVLVALGEQLAAGPAGQDARASGRIGSGQLGDVGDVGDERGREAAGERAQERGADRAGGALGDRAQQVTLIPPGHGCFGKSLHRPPCRDGALDSSLTAVEPADVRPSPILTLHRACRRDLG
jgi:hypothetical protein